MSDDPPRVPNPSTNLTTAELAAFQQQGRASAQPRPSSSILPSRESIESEGYPTWLPKRPRPPQPRSVTNIAGVDVPPAGEIRSSAEDSSVGSPEILSQGQGQPSTSRSRWKKYKDGRNPTPRSVRILTVPGDHQDPVGLAVRSPSMAYTQQRSNAATTGDISSSAPLPAPSTPVRSPRTTGPRPRFRALGLHPELLRNPSVFNHVRFYFQPLVVFAHVPIQAFFDFNAAYMLFQYVLLR